MQRDREVLIKLSAKRRVARRLIRLGDSVGNLGGVLAGNGSGLRLFRV